MMPAGFGTLHASYSRQCPGIKRTVIDFCCMTCPVISRVSMSDASRLMPQFCLVGGLRAMYTRDEMESAARDRPARRRTPVGIRIHRLDDQVTAIVVPFLVIRW